MRAAVYRGNGGQEVIEIADVPVPKPKEKEVLVRVLASALNRVDILQRSGSYPIPADAPKNIPGLEFVGTVEQLGNNASLVKPGDRVFGISSGGAHAEFLVSHESLLMPVPKHLTTFHAAAVPESFMTAYDALWLRGGFAPGMNVLIHAAAGGVGTAVVQLASKSGGVVFATSRSAEKLDRLRKLGAEEVLDLTKDDFLTRIEKATNGIGVNICIDFLGGLYFSKNLEALSSKGTLVLLGLLSGKKTEIDLEVLQRKRLSIVGSRLRNRSLEDKIYLTKLFTEKIIPQIDAGTVYPIVDSIFELDNLSEAHEYMIGNKSFGKIVISISK